MKRTLSLVLTLSMLLALCVCGTASAADAGEEPAVDPSGGYILTGITGNLCAVFVCRLFRIKDPVARGVGIGTASHAIGTAKAFEIGELEGAVSSLSVAVAGILTAVLAPIAINLVF